MSWNKLSIVNIPAASEMMLLKCSLYLGLAPKHPAAPNEAETMKDILSVVLLDKKSAPECQYRFRAIPEYLLELRNQTYWQGVRRTLEDL